MHRSEQIETSLDWFLAYLSKNKRLYWPAVKRNLDKNKESFEELGGVMVTWAAAYLGEAFSRVLADGYAAFVTDVNKSQMKYESCGHYQNKTYEEVFATVYNSRKHMSSYHWGVYVTTFAWEHHLKIYQFYKDYFLSRLNDKTGRLLDLGSGSGVWSLILLRRLNAWRVQGVDISETSVELANNMAKLNAFDNRANYVNADALEYRSEKKYDACISCFLLEHLECPEKLLLNVANNIHDGGCAFITAALTAAEIDHITEFTRESEIVAMSESAGFRVVATYSAAPDPYPTEFKYLPRSMALVLQKRRNSIW